MIALPGGTPIQQEINVELQWNCGDKSRCPTDDDIRQWASAALLAQPEASEISQQTTPDTCSEVSIRIVDGAEMQSANAQWRGQDKTTNVLSFPADFPVEIGLKYYGDILICAEVVESESVQQNKTPDAHWAHMVVHGMLHLQGYDHIEDQQAVEMEQCEVAILARLGYPNPYDPESASESVTMVNITEVDKN